MGAWPKDAALPEKKPYTSANKQKIKQIILCEKLREKQVS